MKATKKNVAAAIEAKHGHKVELVKGNGYFWFTAADDADWKKEPISYAGGSSVYVNSLSAFDVDRWVAEYEELIEGAEVPDHEYEHKVINLSGRVF